MKKLILTFISLLLLSFVFSACNIVSVQNKDLAYAPTADSSAGGVALTIYPNSDETKYINIYRQDTSTTNDEEAKVVSLGLLFPEAWASNAHSYMFEDIWVTKDHTYKYMVRYAEDDGQYYPSSWSDEVTVTANVSSGAIKYGTSDVKLVFNDKDFTLTFKGTPTAPSDSEWDPVLAISSSEKSQVFNLESIEDGTIINLRGLLSQEFLNTKIKVTGIVGQKIIKTEPKDGSTPVTKMIVWTSPAYIEIPEVNDNVITITSETGSSGYDFSYSN